MKMTSRDFVVLDDTSMQDTFFVSCSESSNFIGFKVILCHNPINITSTMSKFITLLPVF